jgi:predicted CopG family antitoxin
MKKIKLLPIKTLQITVDNDTYIKLKRKKGKRTWFSFMFDIAEGP